MSADADFAARFSGALLPAGVDAPPGLKTWNGSDPMKRFSIYRNNVAVSLVEALADAYPVVRALVGEDFFRAMAGEFVRRSPPQSPVLAWYGAGFAEFVEGFAPAAALPYLADTARLEWLRVESWHAMDATPMSPVAISALLADAARLPDARFVLHSAVRVMNSAYPVVSLWAAHQMEDPAAVLADIDLAHAESALLMRPALDVEIFLVSREMADFVRHLRNRQPLGPAAGSGEFDLGTTLGLLIRGGALVGTLPMENVS